MLRSLINESEGHKLRLHIEREKLCRNDEASRETMSIWQMELRVCRVLIAVWLAFHYESASVGSIPSLGTAYLVSFSSIARRYSCRRVSTRIPLYIPLYFVCNYVQRTRSVCLQNSPSREKSRIRVDLNLWLYRRSNTDSSISSVKNVTF